MYLSIYCLSVYLSIYLSSVTPLSVYMVENMIYPVREKKSVLYLCVINFFFYFWVDFDEYNYILMYYDIVLPIT